MPQLGCLASKGAFLGSLRVRVPVITKTSMTENNSLIKKVPWGDEHFKPGALKISHKIPRLFYMHMLVLVFRIDYPIR